MIPIFVYILFVILLIIVFCIHQYFHVWRHIDKIPGPKTHPFIGNILQVGFTIEEHFEALLKAWYQYGCDKFRAWVFNQPYIFITDPKDMECILTSNPIHDKATIYKLLLIFGGNGLITMDYGAKYMRHHKIISSSFNLKLLTEFVMVMNQFADSAIEKLSKYAENGDIFDVRPVAHNYVLNINCGTLLGTSLSPSDEKLVTKLIDTMRIILDLTPKRFFSGIKRFNFLYQFTSDYKIFKNGMQFIREFLSKIVDERRKINQNKNLINNNESSENDLNIKQKKAFLDSLLTAEADGKLLSFDEIFDEAISFMFANDTTKSALSFTSYILSRFPHIQEKVFEEQKQIFGDDMKRDVTYKDIQEMKYLELVIKETLRLFPSAPIIGRSVKETYNLNGLTIPAGTEIMLFLFAMGRSEKYFENPLKFDPNRFTTENRFNKSLYEYIPFSAGQRSCIGQKFSMFQMKTFFSKFIRVYKILPPYEKCCDEMMTHNHDVTDEKLEPPVVNFVLSLNCKDAIRIKLKKRNM